MTRVRYQKDGDIAVVTLDDGKANAMNPELFTELSETLDRVEAEAAGAVVFAGRAKFFSAGLDVKLLPSLAPAELNDLTVTFAQTMLRLYGFPVPTLAACAGHAIAGGAILALACDRRLLLDGPFRFQMNEVAIGIPLPSWMIAIAAGAVPVPALHQLLLHAQVFTPREALAGGIAHALVDEGDDVVARAMEMAAELLLLDRNAYAISKRRMRAADIERVLRQLEEELPA